METQKTITEWAEATFGKTTALDRLVRCNVEAAELISAIHNGASLDIIRSELADVYIIFLQVREALGYREPVDLYDGIHGEPELEAAELCERLGAMMTTMLSRHAPRRYPQQVFNIESCIKLIARSLSVDLQAAVDDKMRINRARSWQRLSSGRFQHA